ncbi:TIM barrel protein [Actinocatenispora comari]|uniref:Putative hydroxypyruvate isomerase n=1 Tax=Actinocatenispora comari TaxID=2807577 RepID=A0A8J4EK00_9ACTN|nr:TIM barrel protein [Actinocatenispora comari]GIL26871.1 putative hydroxypyruvate isomerase [Actinocatenispora comari]
MSWPRYDVNLSILFTELPLLRRPAAAAAAGFDAVEFWWPWPDEPVPDDATVDRFVTAIGDAGVRLVGLNFAAGQLPGPDRGLLSDPARSARFRDNVAVAVDIADRTGCGALNALYGNRIGGLDPAGQDELAIQNLVFAGRAADRIGAVVLIEALNAAESPHYPLLSLADAAAVVDRVAAVSEVDNLRLLCDLYHLARGGETDLPGTIAAHARRIGHVQLADCPGRHQPGTGSLDLAAAQAALADGGYTGWIGLEYVPDGPSADSFGWLDRTSERNTA